MKEKRKKEKRRKETREYMDFKQLRLYVSIMNV